MAAGKYTMNIEQGADYKIKLTIKDSAGALVDLTGHVFRGQIRKNVSDATVQASFTFNILNQVTNKGQVEVLLSNTSSSAIVIDAQAKVNRELVSMPYDIESSNGAEDVRWLEGIVKMSPEVTR